MTQKLLTAAWILAALWALIETILFFHRRRAARPRCQAIDMAHGIQCPRKAERGMVTCSQHRMRHG